MVRQLHRATSFGFTLTLIYLFCSFDVCITGPIAIIFHVRLDVDIAPALRF
jgi:hypothetical protein